MRIERDKQKLRCGAGLRDWMQMARGRTVRWPRDEEIGQEGRWPFDAGCEADDREPFGSANATLEARTLFVPKRHEKISAICPKTELSA